MSSCNHTQPAVCKSKLNHLRPFDWYTKGLTLTKSRKTLALPLKKKPKGGCWAFVLVTVIFSADKQYLAFLFSECRPLCSFQEFESAPCAGKTDRKCTGTLKCVNCAITPDGIVPSGLPIKYTHLPPSPDAVF